MKKIIALLLVFSSTFIIAQTQKADDLIGTYMTDKNEGMVEITKRDNKYFGEIIMD